MEENNLLHTGALINIYIYLLFYYIYYFYVYMIIIIYKDYIKCQYVL